METIFPSEPGYAGLFIIGFQKVPPSPPNATQRTGTIILKRTYDIDPNQGTLSPSSMPLPIFLTDQPENLVQNGDFEADNLDDWVPADDVDIVQVPEADTVDSAQVAENNNHLLSVSGVANGEVVQTIRFPEIVADREFTLSARVKSENGLANVSIGFRVADEEFIQESEDPIGKEFVSISAKGRFSSDKNIDQVEIILRMADNEDCIVLYDDIFFQSILYEHDLAPFKPSTDLIVLDFTDVVEGATVSVNDIQIGMIEAGDLIGWEARTDTDREGLVGSFSEIPNDYPPQWPVIDLKRDPLPMDFDNTFFNGRLRPNRETQFIYLPANAEISIARSGLDNYIFELANEAITANYFIYRGTGPDRDDCWQRVEVEMNIDTLVIEPEKNRCYIVWRGVWNYDQHPLDRYRRLVVTG